MSQTFTQMLGKVEEFHNKHDFANKENNGHDMSYRILLTIEELGQANGGLAPIAVLAAVKLGAAAIAAVGVGIAYGVSKLTEGDDKSDDKGDTKDSDSEE